jgi:DNA-binding beta-propeller fold protein YncE
MKSCRGVLLAGALPAALLAGCFATSAVDNGPVGDGWGWNVGGADESGTATPGDTTQALYPSDLAVDPGTGELVLLTELDGGQGIALVDRDTHVTKATWIVPLWAMSIGMTDTHRAVLSDGVNNYSVDLDTGDYGRILGMEGLANQSASFSDGGGDLGGAGGDGDVATLECEPFAGSPVAIWGGNGTSRSLIASVALQGDSIFHVDGVAYAPDRSLLFALSRGDGIRAIDTKTGAVAFTVTTLSWDSNEGGLAYDATTGAVLTLTTAGNGAWDVTEYPL